MPDKEELKKIKEKIIEKMKTVFDPEIPVNIYELGLIYDIQITESMEAVILMTLTAPNCPEAESLPVEVEMAAKEVPEIKKAKALITFDPPWDKDKMSEEAKLQLNLL